MSIPGRGALCDCAPLEGDLACNGLDDDCDARIDESTLLCGEACVDGATDEANCGGCGVVCGGGSVCVEGACACPPDRPTVCGTSCVDTDGDPNHCGMCGMVCTADPPALGACNAGVCGLGCPTGLGNCDGDDSNGCETETATDPIHCGACDRRCEFTNATMGSCVAGACRVDGCDPGFADCDADGLNGCEANLETDLTDCGGCGMVCAPANAGPRCSARVCVIEACNAGYADCDADVSTGCEAQLSSDPDHCGTCDRVCPASGAPNTEAGCASGSCEVACVAGFGDCNGMVADGCERALGTTNDCGSCGRSCAAGELCRAGVCATGRFTGATGPTFEVIRAGGGVRYPGFSDYGPAGPIDVFALTGGPVLFASLDDGLSWTRRTTPPDWDADGFFAGPAWVGENLYSIGGGAVWRYEIPTSRWTPLLTGLAATRYPQAAHDDAGHVYVLTTDARLLTYDIATNEVSYQPLGVTTVLGARLAWDSITQRLYTNPDFSGTDFYSFDPATGTLVTLPDLPATRFTPTFCSDRSGHLYVAGDNGGTLLWQYDIATSIWATLPAVLPFDHDANGACTVSDDGYLYVTDDGSRLARLGLL